MKRTIIAAGVVAFLCLAGTASASFVITSMNQISPHVRAQLRGHKGARGPQGPSGPAGPAGAAAAQTVSQATGSQATMCDYVGSSCQVGSSVATCPAGTIVTGGGWDGGSLPPTLATVGYNKPLGTNAWEVIMVDNSNGDAGFTQTFNAVATCVGGGGLRAAIANGGLTGAERAQVARDVAAVAAARGAK